MSDTRSDLDTRDPILVLSDRVSGVLEQGDVLTCVAAMALTLTATLEWLREQQPPQQPTEALDELQEQLETLIGDIVELRALAPMPRMH